MSPTHRARIVQTLVWLCVFALIVIPRPAEAQEAASNLQILTETNEVRLHWESGAAQVAATSSGAAGTSLPLVPYGGYLIPLQTFVVQPGDTASAAAIHQVDAVSWTGELTPAPELVPPALDWEPAVPAKTSAPGLPNAPLFELYSGLQRSQPWSVWAFSPLFQDPASGEIRWVQQLDASVAGAQVSGAFDAVAAPDNSALFAPVAALAAAPGPSNPFAGSAGVKVYVSQGGIQQITGAELASAGVSAPAFAKLRLFWRGQEVALTGADANANGVMDAGDTLSFYAQQPLDRWNPEEVYWLVVDAADGLRMAMRSGHGTSAVVRNTALERGRWSDNQIYNSNVAGGDGDHWFHLNATIDPAAVDGAVVFTATLPHRLPLAGGNAGLTLHMAAVDVRPGASGVCLPSSSVLHHRLQIQVGGFVHTDDADDWPVSFGSNCTSPLTRSFTPAQPADTLTVTLLKVQDKVQVLFDGIEWEAPVSLDFGGRGATFRGVEGTWRYALTNTPANRVLYDVSEPLRPEIISVPDGASFHFEDGPAAGGAPRSYLLSGEGTLFTPRLVAHTPVSFGGGAHTVYIAPAQFFAALQPLADWRRSQGYTVAVVDVQAIYDAWSYGRVDPHAIRSFLRYAVGGWTPAPLAAVLVGDGGWDPWNYLGHNNPTHIPPYFADEVDPWLGETACDNCYAQLNGDDPLAEQAFLPDIWIGRFPVADTSELQGVVKKIVDYEQAPDAFAPWRSRSLQLVDDYVRPDGEIDNAGNFPGFVEKIIAQLPAGAGVIRNYFGAATDLSKLAADVRAFIESLKPWFITNPDLALQRSIQQMNGGVGLVTFTGHSNHWQWARLAPASDPNSDKRMFGLWDVLALNNRNTPFIALSMTCYTSQFPIPAPYHFTLDEHLFLHKNGGAVAVWGPAGLSVAHGHDKLQLGFYTALWSAPPRQAKLGALTQSGYAEILKTSPCCIDINRTFLLMGDPLTPARIDARPLVQLPVVRTEPDK
jgi:hypothetical protein